MKLLPENPNLDHLRQQAKDLMEQIRVVKPTATLSEAQTEIAEQYGFRTWPELKAEVDRLSGDVKIGDPTVAAAVAAAFDLGTVTAPMVAVERAWAGHVWSVETDRGAWTATELFGHAGSNIESEIRLVDAARQAGITALRPVRAPNGSPIAEMNGQRWRVHEALKLGPPVAPLAAAPIVGRTLAVLHSLALEAASAMERWLTLHRSPAEWASLASRASAAGVRWAGQLTASLPVFQDLSAIASSGGTERVVLSRCGLGPADLRLGPAGSVVVTKWDHAGPMSPRWELGGALDACAGTRDVVDAASVRACLDAYRDEGGTVDGLDLGIFTSDINAWLNWTATRIERALGQDTDDEAQQIAAREVPGLLANPPSRNRMQRVLDAAHEAAGLAVGA